MLQKENMSIPFNDFKTIHGFKGIILYSEKFGIQQKMITESFDEVEFHKMAKEIIPSLLQAHHNSPENTALSIFYQEYTVYFKRIPDKNFYAFVLGETDMDINLLDIALNVASFHP